MNTIIEHFPWTSSAVFYFFFWFKMYICSNFFKLSPRVCRIIKQTKDIKGSSQTSTSTKHVNISVRNWLFSVVRQVIYITKEGHDTKCPQWYTDLKESASSVMKKVEMILVYLLCFFQYYITRINYLKTGGKFSILKFGWREKIHLFQACTLLSFIVVNDRTRSFRNLLVFVYEVCNNQRKDENKIDFGYLNTICKRKWNVI